VVLATAHIRGGGEMGKKWHDQGRMMSKINTLTDFISCAEYLLEHGYGAKDKLAIEGGSAGGLLMGAVTNMRPDLFKVVVAHVPFVEVINTMLDESLFLTVGEFEVWGNPKIKEQFEYMSKYSPYDNLTKKANPTILVKTLLNDSQVMYWEPARYVARLRAMKTDSNLLVFKINMDPAGHGGQSGRYNRLREIAFDYALILWQLGVVRL
jgi:oligopeptidase B